jgi:hypothetical protein
LARREGDVTYRYTHWRRELREREVPDLETPPPSRQALGAAASFLRARLPDTVPSKVRRVELASAVFNRIYSLAENWARPRAPTIKGWWGGATAVDEEVYT